jgi:hypothetical protein
MLVRSGAARRSYSCTSFPATRSWDPQVGFLRYYRCTVYCARGYPPSDVPAAVAAYDQVRAAEISPTWCARSPADRAHRRALDGRLCRAALGLRHPQLARSLVLAGVGYGAKPGSSRNTAFRARGAGRAEAIGMAAFARELAGSGYAQCLRAKDEAGWRASPISSPSIRRPGWR